MSIVITGATGQLGRLVVESLLRRGATAGDIVATGRNLDRVKDLADRGVQTRAADYNDIESLREVLAGADKVLLISGTEVGQRVMHHQNVIEAAKAAGVQLLAYTSIANADRLDIHLAADHQATEKILADSGLTYTLLRNNLYLDLYTGQVPTYIQYGAVLGSARDGRHNAATRADYAEAAAVVLLSDDQGGRVYELGSDDGFRFADLAVAVSEASGRPVVYRDLPTEKYAKVLAGAGLPEFLAEVMADSHRGIAQGDLLTTSGDLSRLLGRPTTTMNDAVAAAASTTDLT